LKEKAKELFKLAKSYEEEIKALKIIEGIDKDIKNVDDWIIKYETNIKKYDDKIRVLNEMQEPNYVIAADETIKELFSSIDVENEAGMAFMKKIYSLSEEGNDLRIVINTYETTSSEIKTYYSPVWNAVILEPKSNNIRILTHELGHALHHIVLNHKIPDNFLDIVQKAKAISTASGKAHQITENVWNDFSELITREGQIEADRYTELLVKRN